MIAVDHPNEDHFVVEIMNIEIPTNMENDMTQGKKIIEMLAKISKLSIQIKDEKFRLVIENYGLYFEAQSIDMLFENLSSFIKAVCAKLNESSKNGQEKK
ncbi:MAG: hypothetical protein ONB13_05455 [candidate division KSB1 bacterium]|nr:hypothetical protein [candidate division KSB1 bacterium]